MAYKKVQRKDGGFDFFNGDQKINVDQYVQGTGTNKTQLVDSLAQAGDKVSQRFSAIQKLGIAPKAPTKLGKSAFDTVNDFDNKDVDTQRKIRTDIENEANRKDFNSANDIQRTADAKKLLQAIDTAGVKKGGNLKTFGQDLLGGLVNTLAKPGESVQDTVLANNRLKNVQNIISGKTDLDINQVAGATQNIYQNNLQAKAVTKDDGKTTVEKLSPIDFVKKFAGEGADVGLTVAAPGSGAGLVSKVGKQAAQQILKDAGKSTLAQTAAQTGADYVNGREVSPQSIVQNAALTLGGELVGATPTAIRSGTRATGTAIKSQVQAIGDARHAAAEAESGLPRTQYQAINDNEAYTLGDYADDIMKRDKFIQGGSPEAIQELNTRARQARVTAEHAGIDILHGSPADIDSRIADYLEKRDMYKSSLEKASQGGYVQIPGKKPGDELNTNVSSTEPKIRFRAAGESSYVELTKNELADNLFELQSIPAKDRSITQTTAINDYKKALRDFDSISGKPDASTGNAGKNPDIPQQRLLQQTEPAPRELVPSTANTLDSRLPQNDLGNSYPDGTPQTAYSQGKQTRFASRTAPNSGQLSDELAQKVRQSAPDYDPTTNQGSLEGSIGHLQEKGIDGGADDVLNRLDSPNVDRQTVADSLATATALDVRGGEADLRRATEIYDKLSSHLTKAGQTVQAASLLSRRTGQGLVYDAQRQLKTAGVELTPSLRKEINEYGARVDAVTNDPKLSPGFKEESKNRIIAELQKKVNQNIPTEFVDKAIGTWKAGLLTGIRTLSGGTLSNAIFRGLREVSRPGAVAADMVINALGGKRSVALTARGAWRGTREGLAKAGKYLKTGVDERAFSADGKYIDREINFKTKALGVYVNGVFRLMGAADRPFYYSQFRNSLAEAAIVEAKNAGLKGKSFDDYVEKAIKNPTDDAAQYATEIAEKSVLANDTLLSTGVNGLRRAVDKLENPAARIAGKIALGVLAPFTKVPSAFLSRVIDFTPIGPVKELVTQMSTKRIDQAKLVQALSEAATGTGIIYIGAELANNDLLSGNYPNDPTEQARWKTEKKTPNSIKIGGTWYSLNYAGPIGSLFSVGKSIADNLKENAGDATAALTAGIGQLASGTLEQSFLSGVSGALDAVQDPARYAENFVRSQAGSVVPTILNDIGNATDNTQRQANTPSEAIQGRIPGLRTGLNAKTDAFGNELTQGASNPLDRVLNPLRPSEAQSSSITSELDRLNKAGQKIFPTTDKAIQVSGETVKLTPDQQKEYNDSIGQETQVLWTNIINDDGYKSASDEDKKKWLQNAADSVSSVTKKQYLEKIGQAELADKVKLSSDDKRYANGSVAASTFKPSGAKSGTSSTSDTKLKPDSSEYKFLDEASSYSGDDKDAWNTKPVDKKYAKFVDNINKVLPDGLPPVPATNAVAELYAKFAKDSADNKWSKLERNKNTEKLVQNAYKTELSKDQRFISTLSDDELYDAVNSGEIDKADLDTVVGLDNTLHTLGFSQNIGNKLRKALGYGTITASKSSLTKATSKAKGFTIPSIKFDRVASTSSLNKLVSGAGRGIG